MIKIIFSLSLAFFLVSCSHGEFSENSTAFLYGMHLEQQRQDSLPKPEEKTYAMERRRKIVCITTQRGGKGETVCEER